MKKNVFPKFLILILILILLPKEAFCQQQNRLFWDGGDWKRVNQLANGNLDMEYRIKAAYVSGVLDGRLFFYLKTWSVEQGYLGGSFRHRGEDIWGWARIFGWQF